MQDVSQRDGESDAVHMRRLTDELENVQKRLENRDAAAKKYKEGCRTLKERVEQLQQVSSHAATLQHVQSYTSVNLL